MEMSAITRTNINIIGIMYYKSRIRFSCGLYGIYSRHNFVVEFNDPSALKYSLKVFRCRVQK